MSKRHVAETIGLDLELRTARTIYVVALVLFLPGAAFGLVIILAAIPLIAAIMSGQSDTSGGAVAWDIVIGCILVGIEYFVGSQAIEANRRLQSLAENPNANVKPIFVPSFFKNL